MLKHVTVGMFTTGMGVYWPQIPGLKQEIESYAHKVETRLAQSCSVINVGIVSDVRTARESGDRFVREDVDLIVVHAGTYGLSRDILPCIRRSNVPVLSLNLQPVSSFDETSDITRTMGKNPYAISGEIGTALRRKGVPFDVIAGRLEDDEPWERVQEWLTAVDIRRRLRHSTIGIVGSPYNGMSDLYGDHLGLMTTFGVNIEFIEPFELRKAVETVDAPEIDKWVERTAATFDFDDKVTRDRLEWPAQVAAGMARLREERDLSAMTTHFSGYPGSEEERIGYSMTLGGCFLYQDGCPAPVEGDASLCVALLALEYGGASATQGELNIIDYDAGVNYVNHSGPGNISASESRPYLKWLEFFHGKPGQGVSSQFRVKHGEVTLLTVANNGAVPREVLSSVGTSVEGVMLPSGNMNTRVAFPGNDPGRVIEKWVSNGPTHHVAMAPGRLDGVIDKLARALDIRHITIE